MATQPSSGPLGPEDPAPVAVLNTEAGSPFLLIGDHAGKLVPAKLGTLGVSPADMQRHIACDIGVRGLGEALAQRLDATFVHQIYSRLVIDCNRDPASPDAIPEASDTTPIPGNIGLPVSERDARIAALHEPYQSAIAAEIADRSARGQRTILVSLHSFTPRLTSQGGHQPLRPWHIGVLHGGGNPAFALRVLDELDSEPDIIAGDNEPYRMDETDHTVPRHAFVAGLPYIEIEVRQDLIGDEAGQHRWSERIAAALSAAWAAIS